MKSPLPFNPNPHSRQNSMSDFVAYRIDRLRRSGSPMAAIASRLKMTEQRLGTLIEGAQPTSAEAVVLAEVLGGSNLDYKDFNISEDAWWSSQPPAIQAESNRLVKEATHGPAKLIEMDQRYNKRSTSLVFITVASIVASISFGAYNAFKARSLKKEAYTWAIRNTGDRFLAKQQVGIEECAKQIMAVNVINSLVDQSFEDPSSRLAARRVLLDMIRYYKANGMVYEQAMAQGKALMSTPDKWQFDSIICDPITGQPVDVEASSGGRINMEYLRKLVQVDLRTQEFLRLANEVATGKQDPTKIPPLEKWSEASKDATPPTLWRAPQKVSTPAPTKD